MLETQNNPCSLKRELGFQKKLLKEEVASPRSSGPRESGQTGLRAGVGMGACGGYGSWEAEMTIGKCSVLFLALICPTTHRTSYLHFIAPDCPSPFPSDSKVSTVLELGQHSYLPRTLSY